MSYHGSGYLGQLTLPTGGGFAPSKLPSSQPGYSTATTTELTAPGPSTQPSSTVRQEQLYFNAAKMQLADYASALAAATASTALSAEEKTALRRKARAVASTLTQMFNRVGSLYPAGWSTAQLDQLVAIDRSAHMPTDADTALATRSGSSRLIAITNRLLSAWQNLTASLRRRGRWPGSGMTTTGLVKTAAPKPPPPPPPEAAVEPEIDPGEPERAPITPEPRAAPAPAPAPGAEVGRRIPWLWIGGGAAALGAGYLVWRGMRK